jgi:hypothetical protein
VASCSHQLIKKHGVKNDQIAERDGLSGELLLSEHLLSSMWISTSEIEVHCLVHAEVVFHRLVLIPCPGA